MPPKHRLIELPERNDIRGALMFGQEGDHIPFAPKRFFVIYPTSGAQRGAHAHKAQHQFVVMLSGSAAIIIDNGKSRERVMLDRTNIALYAPPMLWLELDEFSDGAICMVLTSDIYAESDYIRDREEFLRLTQ